TASQEEIKNAYRSLAKKFHPDLNPGKKEAEQRFKEISSAYEWIGTPESRAKYDRGEFEQAPPGGEQAWRRGPFYHQTQQGGPSTGGGRYSYSFGENLDDDLFASFFGGRTGGAGRGRALRGEDQVYQMEIDLRDAVSGSEREIQLPSGKHLA